MRIPLTILFLFIIINVFSHQDTFYKYKYDNVSVIIQTGYFNEQVNNVKIIGQYADLLCKKMNYTGDVFLFFGHDYIPNEKSVNHTYMSVGNDSIYQILGFRSYGIQDSLRHPILLNNNEKIVIQQFDVSFNIKTTVELLHFGIKNIELLKNESKNFHAFGYDIFSINDSIIESIKKENTDLVNSVLSNTVYILPESEILQKNKFDYNISYFGENGKYILFDNNKSIIDSLNQINNLSKIQDNLVDYIVVLDNKSNLIVYSNSFLSKGFTKSDTFHLNSINYFEGISDIKLTILKPDILLIELLDWSGLSTDMKYIYLREENVLITDFMDFLNSHKTKK